MSVRGSPCVSAVRRRMRDATWREISLTEIQQKTNSADSAHQVSAAFNKKCHTGVSLTLSSTIIKLRGPAAGRDQHHGSVRVRCAPRLTADKPATFMSRSSQFRDCSTRRTNCSDADCCQQPARVRCTARWSRRLSSRYIHSVRMATIWKSHGSAGSESVVDGTDMPLAVIDERVGDYRLRYLGEQPRPVALPGSWHIEIVIEVSGFDETTWRFPRRGFYQVIGFNMNQALCLFEAP